MSAQYETSRPTDGDAIPLVHHGDTAAAWASLLLAHPVWAILDTEATGLEAQAEMLEVGLLGPDGWVLLESLVQPQRPIPVQTMALHHITNTDVASAPRFAQLYPRLCAALAGVRRSPGQSTPLLVAYNAPYHARLLQRMYTRDGLPVPALRWACAMDLLRWHVMDRDPWDDGRYRPLPGKENHAIADCPAVLRLIESIAQAHP